MKLIIATPTSPHPCFFTKDLTDPEAQKYLGDLQMKYGTPYRLLRMDLEKVFRQLHQLGVTVPSIDQAQTAEPCPTSQSSTPAASPLPTHGA